MLDNPSDFCRAARMKGIEISQIVRVSEAAAQMRVDGQVTTGTFSVSQAAALAALQGDRALLAKRLVCFDTRRKMVVAGLNAMPGITCPEPDGAFYVFPNIEGMMAKGGFATCGEACTWLLEKVHVAIVPGSLLGCRDTRAFLLPMAKTISTKGCHAWQPPSKNCANANQSGEKLWTIPLF